jgi:hypothetical protein
MNTRFLRTAVCLLGAVSGIWAQSASAQSATGQASIFLVGERIAGGKIITVDSGTRKLVPSKRYSYKLTGNLKGESKTALAKLLPKTVSLAQFIESVSPGGSKFLAGTVANPSGTLPFTLLSKKFSGTIKNKSEGNVKVSFILTSRILASGVSQVELTNVTLSKSKKPRLGNIVFTSGSSMSVSAAPLVEFKGSNAFVSEDAGSVSINIFRIQNTAGPASVEFETIPGTANDTHFTPTSGRVVFGNREVKKTITIPILDNELKDGKRIFTVQLKNADDGALLGTRLVTTVNISDNE